MAATDHPICRICQKPHALLDGHIWPKEGDNDKQFGGAQASSVLAAERPRKSAAPSSVGKRSESLNRQAPLLPSQSEPICAPASTSSASKTPAEKKPRATKTPAKSSAPQISSTEAGINGHGEKLPPATPSSSPKETASSLPASSALTIAPISEDKAAKRREQVRLNVAACRARKKEKLGATA